MKRKYELRTYNNADGTLQSTVEIYCNKEEYETIKNALKLINYSCYGNIQIPSGYIKIVLAKDEEILSKVKELIKSLPEVSSYLWQEEDEWWVTNEWLCGTFGGRAFTGPTEDEAIIQLIDYFDELVNHDSINGKIVTESGWPNLDLVKNYLKKSEEDLIS